MPAYRVVEFSMYSLSAASASTSVAKWTPSVSSAFNVLKRLSATALSKQSLAQDDLRSLRFERISILIPLLDLRAERYQCAGQELRDIWPEVEHGD